MGKIIPMNKSQINGLLLDACKRNDPEKIRELLSGADVNARDDEHSTALMWACLRGGVATAEILIKHGANVNIANYYNHTALTAVVARDLRDSAKFLLDSGAKVRLAEIETACVNGHIDIAEMLLKKISEDEPPEYSLACALVGAARGGHVNLVRFLLEEGKDHYAELKRDFRTLAFAAQGTPSELFERFANHRYDGIKDPLEDGYSTLTWAAEQGYYELVEFFLARGSNVNAMTDNGRTALSCAASAGRGKTAQLLVAQGANVNPELSESALTPLMEAASGGHSHVVALLLQLGADPNASTANNLTALHLAVLNNQDSVIEALLVGGANPNVATHSGSTPLAYAEKTGNEKAIALIKAAMATN
jgi:ankyrin repeat protein